MALCRHRYREWQKNPGSGHAFVSTPRSYSFTPPVWSHDCAEGQRSNNEKEEDESAHEKDYPTNVGNHDGAPP